MKAKRVWGLVLAFGLCVGAVGCGGQDATEENTAQTEQTEQTEQTYPIIGVQAEGAYDILLKNSLGQDITGIAIKTADETTYPANMMPSDLVLKNGETAQCFYLPETSTEETQTAGETDVLLNPTYQMQITCERDMVYELSALGLDDIEKEVELCKEDDIVFVKYISKASGDAVSTKEQESAAQAQQDAAQPQEETPAEQTEQTEQPAAQPAEQAPAEPVQQPAQQPAQAEPEPAAQPAQQPTQSAPVEQVPEQTTEGCLTEGGGPVFN